MPPDKLAELIIQNIPEAAARPAAAACDLGLETEKILRAPLAQIAEDHFSSLSVLILLPAEHSTQMPPVSLGLPDSSYQHEKNLITHPEVRSVILSKLQLKSGIMWDLGACSGSVGIEAAGIAGSLHVYSVEKDARRAAHIRENIVNTGVNRIKVINGNIMEIIGTLPLPDRIFIGGGGKEIESIAASAYSLLRPGGIMVVSAVTLETISAMSNFNGENMTEIVTVSVSRSKKVADLRMMKAENPITLFVCRKD
jgi:precorrin-6Y C5,15-methyltransferase (decarboxylating)